MKNVSRNFLHSIISLIAVAFMLSVLVRPAEAQYISNEKLKEPFRKSFVTKHFIIYTFDDQTWAQRSAIFLEDFLTYIERNLISLPSGWPVEIFILPHKQAFYSFCQQYLGEKRNLMGFFSYSRNAFFTYDGTGFGTMAHEIMHKIVHEKFKVIDPWAAEGIPAFYEKIYGYHAKEGAVLYLGYQNPWRLKDLGDQLPNLTIASIMRDAGQQGSRERMLSTFLFQQGKLKEYVVCSNHGDLRGYKTLFEAAFQQPLSALEPKFKSFISAIYRDRIRLETLPSSQYYASELELKRLFHDNAEALKSPFNTAQAKAPEHRLPRITSE